MRNIETFVVECSSPGDLNDYTNDDVSLSLTPTQPVA